MKKPIYFLCLLAVILVASCNGCKTDSDSESLDTVWNEKIQDTFYGLKLGQSITPDSVDSALYRKGFYKLSTYSTAEDLHFRPSHGVFFSFGGFSWEMLDVSLSDGKLFAIRFMNHSNDKASSLEGYNSIKGAMDNKYSPTIYTPKDTTNYATTYYFGNNNVNASVGCFRSESFSKEIFIYTKLWYGLGRMPKTSNDEL